MASRRLGTGAGGTGPTLDRRALTLGLLTLPWLPAWRQAERIVSLVPGATETLFAIGAGERVVGVSSYDRWPPEVRSLTAVGGLIDPDLESILALRPGLVVIDPGQASLRTQLAAAGIDTIDFATADLADMLRNARRLGERLALEEPANALALRVEQGLDAVRQRYRREVPLRVLLVFGRRSGSFAELWINGSVGFLDELVEISGGSNVFADVPRPSFKAGLEAVMARRPDVVVEMRTPELGTRTDEAAIAAEWRSLPRFGDVGVVVVSEAWMLVPGPRVVDAAEILAGRIAAAAPGDALSR